MAQFFQWVHKDVLNNIFGQEFIAWASLVLCVMILVSIIILIVKLRRKSLELVASKKLADELFKIKEVIAQDKSNLEKTLEFVRIQLENERGFSTAMEEKLAEAENTNLSLNKEVAEYKTKFSEIEEKAAKKRMETAKKAADTRKKNAELKKAMTEQVIETEGIKNSEASTIEPKKRSRKTNKKDEKSEK